MLKIKIHLPGVIVLVVEESVNSGLPCALLLVPVRCRCCCSSPGEQVAAVFYIATIYNITVYFR
jgi:hypothetical protein